MGGRQTEDCQICKIIRWYLMIGVPMIVLLWSRPDIEYLRGYRLPNIVATLITGALVAVIGWKYYQEFWRK
jgi:hypothetical protein